MTKMIPANTDMAKKIAAVGLLNAFIAHGFEERKAFVQMVVDVLPGFDNIRGVKKLENFWALREFSINDELNTVLERLKSE
ncbi:hypothetical protein [Myroides odoratimimus]|uniref:hypothetical protein n=1 Tax=Myroides odoratimimus TaxID=76832 RepID=UPI002578C5E4|nr:hypothetical protein [Myroides odoratimimus]MDM1057894.1 hypothetical protein [Myroides odoratimimus]